MLLGRIGRRKLVIESRRARRYRLARCFEIPIRNLKDQFDWHLQIVRAEMTKSVLIIPEEFDALRFHSGISKPAGRGGRRYLPYASTEQGVAMLASVLNSDRVIAVNIAIMRAFVRLREILSTHKDLARKLDEMEKRYGESFRVVFEAIRQLMAPPAAGSKKRRIGFHAQ